MWSESQHWGPQQDNPDSFCLVIIIEYQFYISLSAGHRWGHSSDQDSPSPVLTDSLPRQGSRSINKGELIKGSDGCEEIMGVNDIQKCREGQVDGTGQVEGQIPSF